MPADLTGTPTSLGIGTYNTSIDAPSGLGFNEAMAQIDALIAARMLPPGSPVTDAALVWNGTAWVSASGGDGSGSHYLADDGTYKAISSVGQEVAYQEFTAQVAVTVAWPTTVSVVTAPAFTADGTSYYLVEFFAASVRPAGGGTNGGCYISLHEDGTQIAQLALVVEQNASTNGSAVYAQRRLKPAAGSHTFAITASKDSGGMDYDINVGTGGTGAATTDNAPGFIRITKAT